MKTLTRGHIRFGIDSVRSAKGRSFWTMLGVVIGVASVITIVSIGQGVKDQISGQLHSLGNNIITVRPGQLSTTSSGNASLNSLTGVTISAPLTTHDVSVVQHTKAVSSSAPLTIVPGTATGDNGAYKNGFVIGTSHNLPSLLNQSLMYGSFWSSSDENSNFAILGQTAAQKMFNVDVPLGNSFSFHGQTFIVDGVFNQFTSTPLGEQADLNDAIFIPNNVAESITNNTAPTYAILARGTTAAQTSNVAKNIRQSLSRANGGNGGYQVLSGNQNLAANDSIINLLTGLIAGIASISLLVGGLGIMNVMQVSVSERLREIGIRKAIGATNKQIMSQFLVEASVLSLAGGIIGIIIALLVDVGLRLATSLKPVISPELVGLAAGVALLVGIVFGTIPAIRAARKDPIQALRSE